MSMDNDFKKISWFPGHMAKSLRLIEDSTGLADVIIYVLDARAPMACFNPELNRLAQNKPVLYVLNKADLAEDKSTAEWLKYFAKLGGGAMKLDAKITNSAKALVPHVLKLAAARIAKYADKAVNYKVKGIVVGVPNCGKSTLINNIVGGAKAKVGNKPGVTRGKQWLRISDNFDIMDSPGVLWGNISDQAAARRLAFIGCVKDEILDTAGLTKLLIAELQNLGYGGLLIKRYKLETNVFDVKDGNLAESVFEKIARKRGCLLSGGVIDGERAAALILDEFRAGVLGKMTLEQSDK